MSAITEFEYRYNMTIKRFASIPEPAHETPEHMTEYWGRPWGCSTDVGPLRVVMMHRPGDELSIVDPAKKIPELGSFGDDESGWYWRGNEIPPIEKMQAQHDALADLLRAEGVEVVYVDGGGANGRMKAVFTRDSSFSVPGGQIVTRMGPKIRRGEELPVTRTLGRLGVPILRTIHGTGIMEGGSFAWLNEKTAVIGISSRVNDAGADQVEEVLRVFGVELLRVYLTGYRLHIDGALVMIDVDTAIINPVQLPFTFLERLKAMGIRTVELHPDDSANIINCLAVRPGRVIMPEGASPRTADALDRMGIEILTTPYDAMFQGGGGIHCSTSPLLRDPV